MNESETGFGVDSIHNQHIDGQTMSEYLAEQCRQMTSQGKDIALNLRR